MRFLRTAIAVVVLLNGNACGNAGQINAHNLQTANKSVNFIKEHLPVEQKVEFEMAYWALRERNKNDADFLRLIDGKSAQDLIALAKADFAKQKEAGVKEYAAFDSWEQMLSQQVEQRKIQDSAAVDKRDKKGYPRVDYKMHAM